ncbi:MAG: hypothetical protein QXL67_02765 [Candidatus Bathyarchaeia archaeon]
MRNYSSPRFRGLVLAGVDTTGIKMIREFTGINCICQAVESRETMMASFAKVSLQGSGGGFNRNTNEIPQVNRVVYDITHKPFDNNRVGVKVFLNFRLLH